MAVYYGGGGTQWNEMSTTVTENRMIHLEYGGQGNKTQYIVVVKLTNFY